MALLNRVGQVWPVEEMANSVANAVPCAIDYRDDRLTLTLDNPPGAWLDGFQSALAGKGLRAIREGEGNSLAIRAGPGEEKPHGH